MSAPPLRRSGFGAALPAVACALWTLLAIAPVSSSFGAEASPGPATEKPAIQNPEAANGINWDAVGTIAGVLATAIAAISAWQSQQAARQSVLAGQQSQRAAQAAQMAGLWSDLETLSYFSDEEMTQLDSPEFAEKVRSNANRLGKISFLWAHHLVEPEVLELELGEQGAELYEQIHSLGMLAALNRTGPQLLAQNPNTKAFYEKLRQRFPSHATS